MTGPERQKPIFMEPPDGSKIDLKIQPLIGSWFVRNES